MKKKFDNLNPTKKSSSKKISDAKIDSVLNELDNKKANISKQKPIAFNVKLPENLYKALDNESKRTGLSKKAIVVAALWKRLGE